MNYWLIKFSPKRNSWTDVLVAGKFIIRGVRNYQARNNLQAMAVADRVLYYHSQYDLQVMGVMSVVHSAYQDIHSLDPRWVSVDFVPVQTLPRPVSLQQIKQSPALQQIALIRQPRLAVMPVTQTEYATILSLADNGQLA